MPYKLSSPVKLPQNRSVADERRIAKWLIVKDCREIPLAPLSFIARVTRLFSPAPGGF
jgi:hypothetical protein